MGFKIIRDFVKDKDEEGQVGNVSVRQTGINALFMSEEDQKLCEYRGGKIKVRVKDDDGGIHFHAYIDNDDMSEELLMNWSTTYSGCTNMDMHIDSYRELFGEPKNEKFLSKDGKWYAYIG